MTACKCGARWTGLRVAHCSVCHRTFTTVANFDRHRRGGRCVDPASVDMVRNGRDQWHERGPMSLYQRETPEAS